MGAAVCTLTQHIHRVVLVIVPATSVFGRPIIVLCSFCQPAIPPSLLFFPFSSLALTSRVAQSLSYSASQTSQPPLAESSIRRTILVDSPVTSVKFKFCQVYVKQVVRNAPSFL